MAARAGAAWAFARSGSTWTGLGGKLVGRGRAGQGHDFGHSVALSANSRTAAVGDPGDGGGVGAVWMFTR